MKKVTVAVAVGVLALAFAGCTAEPPSAKDSPSPATETTIVSPAISVGDHEAGQPFFAALIQGELSLTDQNCFGLEGPDGTVTPVVFQKGTTVLADGSGISVPGYGEIEVGDHVSGGGGSFSVEQWPSGVIPPACVAGTVYAILLS